MDYFDGKQPRVISANVGAFFSYYLADASKITDSTWLERTGIPQVFVDFHNADRSGRLRLNCQGTRDDLEAHGIQLRAGLVLEFTDGELHCRGSVEFSSEEGIWVAVIDGGSLRGACDQ